MKVEVTTNSKDRLGEKAIANYKQEQYTAVSCPFETSMVRFFLVITESRLTARIVVANNQALIIHSGKSLNSRNPLPVFSFCLFRKYARPNSPFPFPFEGLPLFLNV